MKADLAITWPTPACRAASMTSVCTCDANPTVGIAARVGSIFIASTVPIGSVRGLLRSKMTSDGGFFRMPPVQYHNAPSPILPVLEEWIRSLKPAPENKP